MLKKSVSSGTSSNFSFSLMGSEMVGSGNTGQGAGARSAGSSSGVLVRRESSERGAAEGGGGGAQVERGWDWREIVTREVGGAGGGKGEEGMVSGREVLERLRGGVVRELAEAELEGDVDLM